MLFILSPEIYVQYFDNLKKVKKSELSLDIDALVCNSNNTHVISKSILNKIESCYANNDFEQFIGPYLSEILDANNTINVAGAFTGDISEIIDSMILNNSRLRAPNIITTSITITETTAPKAADAVVIEKIKKPSFNWVLFKMACYSPTSITLRYSDFISNNQIQAIFDGFVKAFKYGNQPVIMDRQINLNHNLFSTFSAGIIHYYTSFGNTKFRDITNVLPSARVYVGPTDQIHERKIIIGNFILEADDDFWNLEVNRSTWKLDFTHCVTTSDNLRKKQLDYFTRQYR